MSLHARVLVLHDHVRAGAAVDEREVLDQAAAVAMALRAAGHAVSNLAYDAQADMRAAILAARPAVVFNLVESVGGTMRRAPEAPRVLDALGLPYTGASGAVLAAIAAKPDMKTLLVRAGVTTPAWVSDDARGGAVAGGRWIVKSVWEHGSVGLGAGSVVAASDAAELGRAIAARRAGLGGAAYAEAYVEGREFNVALLELDGAPVVLPAAEMVFDGWDDDRERIVDWRAKWDEGSREYRATVRRLDFPAEDAPLLHRLSEISRRCWTALGLGGYARVDFRVDATGMPWVLEVNANPTLAPDAGYAAAVTRSGRALDEAILAILGAARRHP